MAGQGRPGLHACPTKGKTLENPESAEMWGTLGQSFLETRLPSFAC